MLAGIAFGMIRVYPFKVMVRLGVAAGAANALSVGAGVSIRRGTGC
jgi:fructose-1-phosphate kinase PfkB-like protein